MVPGYVFQVSLWVTVQNQIRIAQWVIVNKVIQLRLLRHGHVQRILDPNGVNKNFFSHLGESTPHSRREGAGACRGKALPSCWRKTALPLKSPTGDFIAAQTRHPAFRRKQKIRTLLLSEKSSDFVDVVHLHGLEPWAH